MMRINLTYIGLIVALLLIKPAWADSLFSNSDDDVYSVGLYADHVPIIEVGDIIKVKIVEKTDAEVELSVDTKDSYKNSNKISKSADKLLGRVLTPFLELLGTGDYSHDSSSQFKDDGKTDRSSKLDALVTAVVVEKMPNGNLIIEGRKNVHVNREDQTMVVRGMIDPADLDSDHVIESNYIAEVEIEYVGEGQLSKKTKPGFLSRVIDFIF